MTITFRMQIGASTVTVWNDGHFDLPCAYFLGVPENVELGETVRVGANLWLIETGDRRVLVDTGSGQALQARFPATGAALADLSKETVTDIVLTHMHADHIGGFLGNDWEGAPVHVARAEWDFWTAPGLLEATPEDRKPMIEMIQMVALGLADRVVTHEGAVDLGDGLSLVPLPGHTPGHSGVRVASGGESLLIIGDAVISEALQFAYPDVGYALESDLGMAAETRGRLFAEVAASGERIAATHVPFPGVGTVEKAGDGWRFVAV
ncbi:MAG: MBL fold metallo-hydrolase [Dinoroseobacter sp.]|nr:MBL fold metallo-hydrolase [Dinoroseobacter sp.]